MYKSTNFLANHNAILSVALKKMVVVGCTKVLISQLITTAVLVTSLIFSCCWMYKSTNFLANHNFVVAFDTDVCVVVGCTKVLISQLITTDTHVYSAIQSCCWMYKSTNFLANHNATSFAALKKMVVVGCTKVLISQLITTERSKGP